MGYLFSSHRNALQARSIPGATARLIMMGFLDLNKWCLIVYEGDMDNGLFILFAPERATSALHTLYI